MLRRIQKGSSTYAVYELNVDSESIDKISVSMVNNNQNTSIGLAPIQFEEINGMCNNILYDVTGKVTLTEYIAKNITQDSFKAMIMNLIDTIEQFDEYMIDVHQVMLNTGCVYINELNHSVSFICVPVRKREQSGDLLDFFYSIVKNSHVAITPGQKDYFHCVWNVIQSGNGFSLSNMRTAMTSAKADMVEFTNPEPASTAQPAQPKPSEVGGTVTVSSSQVNPPLQQMPTAAPTVNDDEKKSLFGKLFNPKKKKPEVTRGGYQGGLAGIKNAATNPQQSINPAPPVQVQTPPQSPVQAVNNNLYEYNMKPSQSNVDFGGTTVLNDVPSPNNMPVMTNAGASVGEETTLLQGGISAGTNAYLIRMKTNERFMITKPLIRIGRERNDMDYCINENVAVGHSHANIVLHGNEYFLVDLNSKNHTYVNGMMLQGGVETKLMSGDKINFANERFEFRIE